MPRANAERKVIVTIPAKAYTKLAFEYLNFEAPPRTQMLIMRGCRRYIEKLSLPRGSQPVHVKSDDEPKALNCPLKLRRDMMDSPTPHAGLTRELYNASFSRDHPLPHSVVCGLSHTRQGLLSLPPVSSANNSSNTIEAMERITLVILVTPKFGHILHFSCQICAVMNPMM
jgi:hypothetical protein